MSPQNGEEQIKIVIGKTHVHTCAQIHIFSPEETQIFLLLKICEMFQLKI